MNSSDAPRIGRWNQKITKVQKKYLLTYVAGAGENYAAYLQFCERHDIPTFSKYYWPNFVQRNRKTVQAIRVGLIAQVAAEATLDRKARLSLLEDDIARIEKTFAADDDEKSGFYKELTLDQMVKLIDQKRKTLEAIAKERSEWMQPEERVPDNPAALAMAEAFKRLQSQAMLPPVVEEVPIEGEVREIPVEALSDA